VDDTDTVSVYCESDDYVIDEPQIISIAHTIMNRLDVADYELSIGFVGLREIQELNREHRGKDRPTDVLSFPQVVFPEPRKVRTTKAATPPKPAPPLKPPEVLGDIVIALPVAAESAQDIGQTLAREVCFLMVHGALHLCGHDHETPEEEAVMLTEQRKLMELLDAGAGSRPAWAGMVEPCGKPTETN